MVEAGRGDSPRITAGRRAGGVVLKQLEGVVEWGMVSLFGVALRLHD